MMSAFTATLTATPTSATASSDATTSVPPIHAAIHVASSEKTITIPAFATRIL
jgi:hypothetical protein